MTADGRSGSAVVGVVWPGRPATANERDDLRAWLPPGAALVLAAPDPPDRPPQATLERVLFLAASDEIERCADQLATCRPRAVAYACGTASYVNGPGSDRTIAERLRRRCFVPATTTSTEMLNALRALAVSRVAVLSPHIAQLNERLSAFLAAAGVTAVATKGLGLLSGIEDTPPEAIVALARAADCAAAEAVYIACTSLQTASVIERIEAELGKPVVTANQATMWGLLGLAGLPRARPDRGRLFRARVAA